MRSAVSQGNQLFKQGQQGAATYGSEAQNIQSQLLPFYRGYMNESHGLTPEQQNEQLDYASAGAGGANAALSGQAALEGARTRNSNALTAALDAASRNRGQQMAKANQAVGMEDINLANQHHQQGAEGMAGLYGADTRTMLGEQGIQNDAIKDEVAANNTGWMQNLNGFLSAINGAGYGKLKV